MDEALLRLRWVLQAMAVGYGVIFLLCVGLVVYMRYHRSGAFRGDSRAARRVLLPAFQPLLWLLTAVSLLYTISLALLLTLVPIYEMGGVVKSEMYYSGRVFVIALPLLYLRQQAVTTRALIRAVMLSLLLAVYNIPIVWLGEQTDWIKTAHYVTLVTGALPLLVLGYVCLVKSDRASQRTLKEYAAFVVIYYALRIAYSQLLYIGITVCDEAFVLCLVSVFWGSLCPAVIWRVIKADTDHWRGLGQRAVHLQMLFREKYHYLQERVSSRGLHVLIEMHRKHIIDFAYLELKHKIGAGASAVVFKGVLHSKIPVAVKVYTPRVLTEETVAEFSHEAALCGALYHPNIVQFYGMCVCPPTVCLVSELCHASLEDVVRASARRHLHQRQNASYQHEDLDRSQDYLQQRQQLLIDLNYMIDATRAVVYLHSFSPAFLHRDLKPSNFLVDVMGTCKLTDFGESRSVPTGTKSDRNKIQTDSHSATAPTTGSGLLEADGLYLGVDTPTQPTFLQPPPPRTLRPSMRVRERNAMTVRGTADYMAPEMIEGKAGTAVYGEAADIYSLAITLWDIANPLGSKYPEATRSHLQVFDSVLEGERPPLEASMHPELRRLITEAWNPQPERRPSATYILKALETLHQEVSAQTALKLASSVASVETPSGQHLIKSLVDLEYVDSISEACRVGNSLMSAGFLHHVRHQESFRKPDEQFYFDTDVLKLYALTTPDSAVPFTSTSMGTIDEGDPFASEQKKQSRQGINQRRRATDSPAHIRCFSPLPEGKTRSATTACRRVSLEFTACACRKLGRGEEIDDRGQRKKFHWNKKWFSIMEDSITTEMTLQQELESQPSLATTDEFEDYPSGNWEDMESGATAIYGSEVLNVDEEIEIGNGDDDDVRSRSSIVII